MKWGKTKKKRAQEQAEHLRRIQTPKMHFAFIPVELEDGRMAWWEWVVAEYSVWTGLWTYTPLDITASNPRKQPRGPGRS